jgi:hypothetical protein
MLEEERRQADKLRKGDKSTKGLLVRQKGTSLSIVLHGLRAVGKNVQKL